MHQVQRETFLHFIIFTKASVEKFRPRCASFLFLNVKKLIKKVRNFTFEIVQIGGEKKPGNFHKQLDCIVIAPFANTACIILDFSWRNCSIWGRKTNKIFAVVLQHVLFNVLFSKSWCFGFSSGHFLL